jgi:hypothetical protein
LQLKKPNKIEKIKTILYYLKDKNTRREKQEIQLLQVEKIQKKESRIRGKTTKNDSDRETRKKARFLPLLKKEEIKRKYRYCRSCKFNCRHCKTRTT